MARKGCNPLACTEKILIHIAWIGMTSYMELSNEFQYPKSGLPSLLNVMVEYDFLIKSKNGYYSLRIKNHKLGCQALHRQNIFEVAKRPIQELPLKGGLVCHLGAMESISAIYLDKVESPDSVPASKSRIGEKFELRTTVLDKALLAWKTREELDYFLEALVLAPYTHNAFISKRLLLEELQKICLRGWIIDDEESTHGAVYLSMSVSNTYDGINYTILPPGDPVVYPGNEIDSYLELLRKCAEQISYGLGYRNGNERPQKGN